MRSKNEESQQSTLDSKNFVMGDLNKSIESVVMKGIDSNNSRIYKQKDHRN